MWVVLIHNHTPTSLFAMPSLISSLPPSSTFTFIRRLSQCPAGEAYPRLLYFSAIGHQWSGVHDSFHQGSTHSDNDWVANAVPPLADGDVVGIRQDASTGRIELYRNASEVEGKDGTFFNSTTLRQVNLDYSTTAGVAAMGVYDYQLVWTYTPLYADGDGDRTSPPAVLRRGTAASPTTS